VRLLISGSKVRVLDGPPNKTRGSGLPGPLRRLYSWLMCDRLRDFLRGQYGIEASDGGTQVLWRQVGIAHYHRQGAVAEEVFQLGQGRGPVESPTRRRCGGDRETGKLERLAIDNRAL
jgi:hypothetical protein